ncbi:MAG: DNA-formamidopyrimidine glycosylase [Candidatus Buchananbacteria bacterium]
MPELPEVETLRRELNHAIKGKTIQAAWVNWSKMVKPLTISEFQRKIKKLKIIEVKRLSKVLVLNLAGPLSLLIHLKLTGQLIFQPRNGQAIVGGHPQKDGENNLPNKFTHLVLSFTDGTKLYFNDMRKFGWAKLVDDLGVAEIVKKHGPEPLSKEFTFSYFQNVIKKYPNRKIKQILLDQALIGGIGNIYCDESCFCAKILPQRPASQIKPAEAKKLYACINKIIKFAIAKNGTSADTYVRLNGQSGGMLPYLKVYGRAGEKCRRCGGVVVRTKLNGRGTHFCRKCQK